MFLIFISHLTDESCYILFPHQQRFNSLHIFFLASRYLVNYVSVLKSTVHLHWMIIYCTYHHAREKKLQPFAPSHYRVLYLPSPPVVKILTCKKLIYKNLKSSGHIRDMLKTGRRGEIWMLAAHSGDWKLLMRLPAKIALYQCVQAQLCSSELCLQATWGLSLHNEPTFPQLTHNKGLSSQHISTSAQACDETAWG